MLVPNIIKITCGTQWLFTFDLEDPYTHEPVSVDNDFVTYRIEVPKTKAVIWSCGWNTGIEPDPIEPGRVHVFVPNFISRYLPAGLYTYVLTIVPKEYDTYVTTMEGTIQSVPLSPIPDQILGESDPVAKPMIEQETLRALAAEEALSERIAVLEQRLNQEDPEDQEDHQEQK